MEWQIFTLVLIALVGSHAVPITKPLERISSDSLATDDKPVNTVNNAAKQVSSKNYTDSSKGLQLDCEEICKLCNATAKLEKDGSCKCLSQNGGEVECVHFPRFKKELKESSESPGIGTEKGKDSEREQRCLGLLGSSKDTIPVPANSLQTILGNGLLSMSPADRAEEFRKRVDALRAITVTNIQNALEKAPAVKIEPLKVPVLEIPPLPKTSAAVSPFIGKPVEEVLGKPKEEESLLPKEDKIIQTQKPFDEPTLIIPSKATVNFNIPDFTFRSQIPLVQSNSGIYTPSGLINLRTPPMTGNFLPQQLRMHPIAFGSFGNYRREGRVLRSSDGPFSLVQSPIIPNPSIGGYDSFQSSSTDTTPNIAEEQLSLEKNPQDLSESKSAKSQASFSMNSQFHPTNFTHSIFKIADGDLTSIGKLVDSMGAEKGIGSMVQALIVLPEDDKETVKGTPEDNDSNK